MDLEFLDFDILEPISGLKEVRTLTYRTTIGHIDPIQFIGFKWVKAKRTRVAKIGVSRNPDDTESLMGTDVFPEVERGRTWYWNLGTKQLEDSKFGPPYKPYPASGAPQLEIPEFFWMELNMNQGKLGFILPSLPSEKMRDLGVAFDNLTEHSWQPLHVNFVAVYDEDEAEKVPTEFLRRLDSKQRSKLTKMIV